MFGTHLLPRPLILDDGLPEPTDLSSLGEGARVLHERKDVKGEFDGQVAQEIAFQTGLDQLLHMAALGRGEERQKGMQEIRAEVMREGRERVQGRLKERRRRTSLQSGDHARRAHLRLSLQRLLSPIFSLQAIHGMIGT